MHIWIAFPFLPSHITVSIIYTASSIHIPNQIFFFLSDDELAFWFMEIYNSSWILHTYKILFLHYFKFFYSNIKFFNKKKKKDAHKLCFLYKHNWILFFHLNPILNIFKHNFNINSAKKKKKTKAMMQM